jgi:hypothetical protein
MVVAGGRRGGRVVCVRAVLSVALRARVYLNVRACMCVCVRACMRECVRVRACAATAMHKASM